MKPGDGGRKWIKLWVNEWLDGTTRWQLTGAQRAFWMDLLAMAGRGRVGGIVCSGKDGDALVGYPLQYFQALSRDPIDVLAAFALFERTGKIKVEISGDELKLYVIHILSWDRYQSEYERTKQYREPATPDATEKLHGKYKKATPRSRSKNLEVDSDSDSDSDSEPDPEKNDDDDDAPSRKKRAKAAVNNLDPTLRAWASARILHSARELGIPVNSERAYVRKSMPEFLDDLPSEILTYLTQQAADYVGQRLAKNPKITVPYDETLRVLRIEAQKHHLSVDDDVLIGAIRAASVARGFCERPIQK